MRIRIVYNGREYVFEGEGLEALKKADAQVVAWRSAR